MDEIQTAINYIKIQKKNNENKLIDSSIKQAYQTILWVLENQVPVKPREIRTTDKDGYCNCGNEVCNSNKYCCECGRKLDWS